jgi:ABC-type uncharacterized transport system involved in gliding motility auxiliary subunit
MRSIPDRIAPTLPWLGLALILVGAVAYVIKRNFELITNLPLLAGVLCLLVYTVLRPDDVRRLVSGRRAKYGANTFLAILFFTIIAVLVYWIAFQNPDWRLDLTETDEFSPLPETVLLLEELAEPVHVIGFYSAQMAGQQAVDETVLESLKAVNNQLTYEFLDPVADPISAQQYDLTADATLVFVMGEGDDQVFSKSNSSNDREIHSALLQIFNPIEKKAYFLTGHGERGMEDFGPEGISSLVGELGTHGFTVEELNLAVTGEVPEDTDVVVLIDQLAPMQPAEIEALADYFEGGGRAFFGRDVVLDEARGRADADGLADLISNTWGIELQSQFIIEPEFALANQLIPVQFASYDFSPGPITGSELASLGTLFDIARPVGNVEMDQVIQSQLVLTSPSSWGESDFDSEPRFDNADTLGPLAVGVSGENVENDSRVVVVGDVDFLSNNLVFFGGNNLFFTNSLNWLAGDEAALELAPRETVNRQMVISQSQLGILQVLGCLLAPALMALIGFVVWYSRRSAA